MVFNPTTRTRRWVAAALATGVVGASATGAVTTVQSAHATPAAQSAQTKAPPGAALTASPTRAYAPASTVPKSLTRAESAAEDVIGFLEKGQPAKSRAEARLLRGLAHGAAAKALHNAGVSRAQIAEFQQRADRTAQLSRSGAAALQVSQAANSVSQLMPGFYARYHDPVPPAVLRLDYLDRQIQLDAKAGDHAKLRHTVARLEATWNGLRPRLVKAGGAQVAASYDRHITAVKAAPDGVAAQVEAVHGLDIVDQMEGVFLGK